MPLVTAMAGRLLLWLVQQVHAQHHCRQSRPTWLLTAAMVCITQNIPRRMKALPLPPPD
jgi:hypothetical protein